jgi:hypothetical protein
MTSGGTPFYYHYDGLGSVANLTSATGVTPVSLHHPPSAGVSETVGAGGVTGIVAGVAPFNIEVSTAGCVNQLGGGFTEAGAIGGEIGQASANVFASNNVFGFSVSGGGGVDYSPPFLPGVAYVAHTETSTLSVGDKCGNNSK